MLLIKIGPVIKLPTRAGYSKLLKNAPQMVLSLLLSMVLPDGLKIGTVPHSSSTNCLWDIANT